MPRISTFQQDTTVSKSDQWIGTDSETGATRNYSIQSFVDLINDENLVNLFDGVLYQFAAVDSSATGKGIVSVTGTNTLTTAFNAITSIHFHVKDTEGNGVANYLEKTLDNYIKISEQGNLNNFGIYEVTAIEDWNTYYKKLTVTLRDFNGSMSPNAYYFLSNYQAINDQDFSDDSVTEFGDVTDAGSGQIISNIERTNYNEIYQNGLRHADIVDNLTTQDAGVPLSANQGKVLKDAVDAINTLLTSDETDLDTIQEIVDYIEANRDTLENLGISNIAGLQTALDSKVDKITGKGLSANDFTDLLLAKLNAIEAGAEVNVQADWTESVTTNDAFIQNKPTDVTDLSIHDATELRDISDSGSGYIITNEERTSISGLDHNYTDGTASADDIQVKGDAYITGKVDFSGVLSLHDPQDQEAIYSYSTSPTDNHLTFKQNGYRYDLDYYSNNLTTGLLHGGELSVVNTGIIEVSSGQGIIVNLNKSSTRTAPQVTEVSWDTQQISVSNLQSGNPDQLNQWFYVDANSTIQQQPGAFSDSQYKSQIVLGSVIHSDGYVRFVKTFPSPAYGNQADFGIFARIFGPLKKTGHVISAYSTGLGLNRSSGVAFALGRNYANDKDNPSLITDAAEENVTIHRYYQDGSGGFVKDDGAQGAGYTALDFINYDDGTGTLATVGNNKFTTQRLYYFPGTPNIVISYYGRNEYQSLDEANTNINAESFTEDTNTATQAIFLGYVIGENTVTDLSAATNSRIIQGGLFRSVAFTSTGAAAGTSNLPDLGDVQVGSPQNDQILQYNSSTSAWENKNLQDYNSFAVAMAIALGG
tara:strand:+ start:596 stop:3046 length:2451 start_codon:yes stop_codon:yes gene_type:complete